MLVAMSILLAVVVALAAVEGQYFRTVYATSPEVKAAYLLEEGVEAVKLLRDSSWSTYITPLSTSVTYYYTWTGSLWRETVTPALIDTLFARTFVVENVYRDSNKDIQSSGTLDPNTKKFTVSVAWKAGSATTTRQVATYITNMFNN